MILRQHTDTIVAAATPSGKSALAITRLSGPDALAIVGRIVSDPLDLYSARGNTCLYTDVLSDGSVLDDVVITVFRSPRSFTGEDLIEISSHGSIVITSRLVQLLLGNGARQALPGEFSQRAYYNGKISLERAELISARIEAETSGELRGAERALKEKYDRLLAVYDGLIAILAKINAEIDFGESDDLAFLDLEEDRSAVLKAVQELLDLVRTRAANAAYLTVALVGPPNVGKSSLFNALLNYERSIVSETPGTTRDYVEAFINIEGFRVKLVDTAGIRSADEPIEARGIELGREASAQADLTLQLTEPFSRSQHAEQGAILVHNKSDLDDWDSGLAISARTGQGLEVLHQLIVDRCRDQIEEHSPVRMSEAELDLLSQIWDQVHALDLNRDIVMVAEDLRLVISHASQLLGTNINEDTLNHIFLKMCIGK
jgi:tRNA modification GTPase